MMGFDRSELVEKLINDHLRRYVVSDRGGPENASQRSRGIGQGGTAYLDTQIARIALANAYPHRQRGGYAASRICLSATTGSGLLLAMPFSLTLPVPPPGAEGDDHETPRTRGHRLKQTGHVSPPMSVMGGN